MVEDEATLARAVASGIGEVHDVTVARNGRDALALLSERHFDAVLCDLRMAGMSGETVYAHVSEHHPALARAFVFMTGVGFGAGVERFLTAAGCPILEKPFSIEQALAAIHAVTSQRHEAPDRPAT